MPIYDYKCSQCGRFDKMQKISEEPLTECPVCGSPVQRLISKNVGIVLKGPGFYKTDSGSAAKAKARMINQERQKDNEALLDGDVGGYVDQAESTTNKIAGS
ncbi:MAG: transcriptional regulator [Syntrophomonadaceae bacterium]|jgi:putative FmdB family regulatory protein|nr:transcriptional regulator [Syntrophomonadaceae bacterium]